MDEKGFLIPTPKREFYKHGPRGSYKKREKKEEISEEFFTPTPVGHSRNSKHASYWEHYRGNYKETDPEKLAAFWIRALRFGLSEGMPAERAEDFAQEVTLAFARNGEATMEVAKMNFWNKYDRKWENIVAFCTDSIETMEELEGDET